MLVGGVLDDLHARASPHRHRASATLCSAVGNDGGGSDSGGGGRVATIQPPDDDDDSAGQQPWVAVAVAAAGTAAVAIPWARRGIRFWLGVTPILLSYALLLLHSAVLRCGEEERRTRLAAHHERCAPAALRLVQRLAGGYIKMGQVLSNRADLLPLPYVLAFGALQDQVPARPWRQMERRLRRDAPALWRELRAVDETPLGAASTGQVHHMTLRDGRECAVKLQYAEARAQFGHDFGNVARLARLALPALVPVVREVRRRFRREFDYAREAEDMLLLRDALGASPYADRVAVPAAYPSLGSARVLVMEYLPGEKLLASVQRRAAAALGDEGYAWARARALSLPPPTGARPPTLRRRLRSAPQLWRLRRQTRATVATLARVHGYEIFRVGSFNADPHPGNVLLLPSGKLGLIDYGQVVHLSDEQRRRLARLVVALARTGRGGSGGGGGGGGHGDTAAVAAAAEAMGFRTKRMDPDVLCALGSVLFDRDVPGEGPSRVLKRLDSRDRLLALPDDLVLAARVSLLLRGMSQLMAQRRIGTASLWQPEAERVMRELGE